MTDQNDPQAEEAIRGWLDAAPDRAPERAVLDTIDSLRKTSQPRVVVLRLSLPMAAAFLVLTLVVGAVAVGSATQSMWQPPPPTASPSPSPTCSIESAVSGQWPVMLGRGFKPETDVVLEVDRADGGHATITRQDRAELRTDKQGRFGITLRPFEADIGVGTMTAIAGCTATIQFTVTADQIPATCADQDNVAPFRDTDAYRAAVAVDDPLRWYHLDDTGEVIADAASGADGTRTGTLMPLPRVGDAHVQLFDGISSYIKLPAVTLDDFSVEAWVYLCALASNRDAIVGHGDGTPNINMFENHPRLFTGDDIAADAVIANTAASWDQWQHWVVTRDGTATRIYLDGILDASAGPYTGAAIFDEIGRGDAGILDGMLDEVAIYDRALTAEQVASHFNASR